MLTGHKSFGSFSTDDLDKAKDFYHNKLGLEISVDIDGAVRFETAGGGFMVYYKPDHTPANFTVLNFEVENLREMVEKFKSAGIQMEQYPEMGTDENGISSNEESTMAWFKDPAGNIIGLLEILS